MNEHNDNNTSDRELTPGGGVPEPLPGPGNPELDSLLRQWHQMNAARVVAGREKLLASIAAVGKTGHPPEQVGVSERETARNNEPKPLLRLNLPSLMEGIATDLNDDQQAGRRRHAPHERPGILRSIMMNRYSPLAAAMLLLASVMSYFVASNFNQQSSSLENGRYIGGVPAKPLALTGRDNTAIIKQACFDKYVMAPDGGRLDAVDRRGDSLGPCILKHTDVEVNVAGFLNRVNIKQVYLNPHSDKIEAVYTFPLSERAAVDRMTMTIGSRVIEGQVKERAEAKRIYEQAKAQGRVASLLEQERPNIFTQSIANIEPAAEVVIEISYVEVLEQRDGQYSITFPTTIAPRYIPGDMMTWDREAGRKSSPPAPVDSLPPDLAPRRGIVLLGPAQVVETQPGDTSHGSLDADRLRNELAHSRPVKQVRQPGNTAVWYNFVVRYEDGSKELGTLYTSGTGVVNGRTFFSPTLARQAGAWPVPVIPHGEPEAQADGTFAGPTPQVPDAARITPRPVKPPMRAGQDISITVNIDTGGPAITNVKSQLHEVDVAGAGVAGAVGEAPPANNSTSRKTIRLRNQGEIPNRDFTLAWNVAGGIDSPMVLTHTAAQGNFFFVSVLPPERADDSIAVPREIMFVLDRSGSMRGFKIEQAKALIDATLATMRPVDTFNVLAFSNTSEKLWPAPRHATPENLAEARAFYGRSEGQGATEMLRVIGEALAQPTFLQPVPQPRIEALSPEALSNLPADGREVIVDVPNGRLVNMPFVPQKDGGNRPPPGAVPGFGNIPPGQPGNETPSASSVNAVIHMGSGVPDIKVRMSRRLSAMLSPQIRLAGTWITEKGDRILNVTQVDTGDAPVVMAPEQLSNLPADGREVVMDVPAERLKSVIVKVGTPPVDTAPIPSDFPPGYGPASDRGVNVTISMQDGSPDLRVRIKGSVVTRITPWVRLTGKWITENGDRFLDVTRMGAGDGLAPAQIRRGNPIRLVAFITDGEVGNDMEVLAAVKQYRGTARVFSFAIGDSPNRYLLDGMARLGRGEVDYVPNNSDPREVIARFTRRVATPVLTDIHATFSPNIQPVDVLTALGGGGGSGERVSDFEAIPDLYDQKPV
ncbi:MAG: hypothetical protein H7210_08310, partial [Pyrinomonadaceae bacterium]|nr:hypothetical protein [Phycisphaerales bacterium]